MIVDSVGCDEIGDGGLAASDGAGFVEQNGRQLAGAFQGFAVTEEDTGFSAASAADHDGGRRRQSERAGAGDDEHGDHVEDGLREAGASECEPAYQRHGCQENDGRDEVGGDAIGDGLDGRFAGLGVFHQADDLREDGIAADALRLDDQPALLVDGSGDDLGAYGFVDPAGSRR